MNAKFGFLLFNNFEDMDFVGPWEMIAHWGKYEGGPDTLITVSENGGMVTSVLGLPIQSNVSLEQCPALDYLLIPGGLGTRQEVNNPKLISFIEKQATHCKNILSVCTGAFMLQAAGLLKNKKATTHWASIERLEQFKDTTVVQERFVHDGNVWTSAGISAGIDLALAFIAAIAGDEVAGRVQLYTEYYPSRKLYSADNKLPAYAKESHFHDE